MGSEVSWFFQEFKPESTHEPGIRNCVDCNLFWRNVARG
ncbi:conserved protein of unknown function [Limnospira indica PCC 8005]|uniref:Uncharacterized protein n=1 Tax=Limnospira indica PCC 8005 TaxID=376219 RepID=A0A9P1KBJ8_9CYAN|nr:conserved protein of unknown function [Limnospira indica PCC 8005]